MSESPMAASSDEVCLEKSIHRSRRRQRYHPMNLELEPPENKMGRIDRKVGVPEILMEVTMMEMVHPIDLEVDG